MSLRYNFVMMFLCFLCIALKSSFSAYSAVASICLGAPQFWMLASPGI